MATFVTTPVSGNTPESGSLQGLATSPQRVRTDEGTVEERPIEEIIQADAYNRLDNPPKTSIGPRNLFGMGIVKTRPSDSLGTQGSFPQGVRLY